MVQINLSTPYNKKVLTKSQFSSAENEVFPGGSVVPPMSRFPASPPQQTWLDIPAQQVSHLKATSAQSLGTKSVTRADEHVWHLKKVLDAKYGGGGTIKTN